MYLTLDNYQMQRINIYKIGVKLLNTALDKDTVLPKLLVSSF